MSFIKEFKEFALKGNLVDMAVAFVMGAAFGKVVTSFIEKMFAPLVGLMMGGVNLSEQRVVIKEAIVEVADASGKIITKAAPEVAVEWGMFVTAIIDFTIVALAMFLLIKLMNKMKKKEEAAPTAPPEPSSTDKLLIEIRDQLKK